MSAKWKFRWHRYRSRILETKTAMVLVIAVAIIAAISIAAYLFTTPAGEPFVILTGLSTAGYVQVSVEADIIGSQGVATLTGGCYRMIAYVEDYQAESIIRGIEGEYSARPNAHDIAADAFQTLGVELLMVKITDMRNNTYYGKMILKNGNNYATIDARPSDATAIAVRMGVPIYVKEDLLKTYGDNIC